jgi:N-acetylglucosaminyldiphosphoundecaprenol N-acetyl-beta-D-mannosaminyltransferase
MTRSRIIVLDVDNISFNHALELVMKWGKERMPSYTCFANVHMSIEAYKSREFSDYVNQATLVAADGKPIAISSKILYGIHQERIAGMDFMPAIIDTCDREGLSVFLFGSTDHILSTLYEKIQLEHPKLVLAGKISPPFRDFSEHEIQGFINQINESKANVVLVGMGCPKQETWMAKNYSYINATLLGVGGAFSVYAGLVKRAPRWMQKFSLEWLYRLLQEPGRMWKRYLVTNTLFIYLVAKQLIQRDKTNDA